MPFFFLDISLKCDIIHYLCSLTPASVSPHVVSTSCSGEKWRASILSADHRCIISTCVASDIHRYENSLRGYTAD